MNESADTLRTHVLEDVIAELEARLQTAKARLAQCHGAKLNPDTTPSPSHLLQSSGPLSASPHHFLLLADSALPLGSFAFSSGLESYVAHTRPASSFPAFLALSLSSYASTTLSFVLAAHRDPASLAALDDTLDAAILCVVNRRASVAQGRALLSVWDRSLAPALSSTAPADGIEVLKSFTLLLRSSATAASTSIPTVSAHLGPLFGTIAYTAGLSLQQTAYVFILNHVKALLSAAVRASLFGPYHAQKVLASAHVQETIVEVVGREWSRSVEDAGQSVPVMDLWGGRHEMLYSRIFNS